MYTVASEITDLKGEFEGGNSLRVNWYSLLRRGLHNLLDNVSPETLKRKVPIYGGLAKNLSIYYCPADVLVPSDLYSNDGLRRYKYMPPAQFYRQTLYDKFTIEYVNGVRFLVIRHSIDESALILDEMSSTTGFTQTNITLAENDQNYLSGSNALSGTLSGASANILKTLESAQDITDYARGVAIVPLYLTDEDDFVSASLQLLTSSGNYFQVATTQDSIGDNTIDGWNLLRFDLASRTSVGSPNIASITQFRLTITTTLGTQKVIVDRITLQKSALFYFEYYSNYGFIDGATGGWKDEPEDGSNDYINLNRDSAGILHYEVAKLVLQGAKFDRTDSQIAKRFKEELDNKYDQYFLRHPSSEMPISYNISPSIPHEVPLEDTFPSVDTITVEDESAGIAFVSNETPVGAMDGSNTVFTLTQTPNPASSLQLYLNNAFMTQGVDYTLSDNEITMTTPPPASLPFVAFFRYTT